MIRGRISALLSLVTSLVMTTTPGLAGGGRQSQSPLPRVVEAEVPQYPQEAAAAGAVGVVPISVTTDGHKVVSARVLQSHPGPALLHEAAVRNVRTWRFAPHAAATFDLTFRYAIVDRPCISLGRDTHAAATIHFPTQVEVFSERDAACPGAARLPPAFGIFVREASVPFFPADARAQGIEGAVTIGVTYKGVLSLADGPEALGQPIIEAIRNWMLVPGPYSEEMKFRFRLVDDCRGGPVVTVGPGLTTYDVTDCRRER